MSGFTPAELAWLAIGVSALLALIILTIGLLRSKPAAVRQAEAPQPTPRPAPAPQPAPQARPTPQTQAPPAPPSVVSPPTQPDEEEEDEPKRIPNILTVLPKGSSYVYGLLASILVAILVWYPSYWLLGMFFPIAMAIDTLAFVAWFATLSTGALLGLTLFAKGFGAPAIPVGSKGVPTILSGRFSFFGLKLLFDEGEAWGTRIAGFKPVDMRIRSLIVKTDPNDEEIEIIALALVPPPPTNGPKNPDLVEMEKFFFAKVTVRVAVRIQVFDPFLWLSADNAEGILFSAIKERVRLWIKKEQLYQLPSLKNTLTAHLRKSLDEISWGMGVDFVKIFVTEILPPDNVLAEAAQIPVDLVRRAAQGYQAETVDRITDLLKKKYPGLSDRDMKDLVLTTMGLATTQVVSIAGQQGNLSLLGINAKGG